MFAPHFGVDESGKGDFFGPLVIAGAYTNENITRHLLDHGIMDSKRIKSDKRIRELAAVVKETPGLSYDIIELQPAKYNEMYESFANLNRLLAWGHATVIANLAVKQPSCPRALSDQFANPRELKMALQKKNCSIELQQRTKAESDIAVAAASILAREKFIDWIENTSEKLGQNLPKGASSLVKETGRELVRVHGDEILRDNAKLHFKTAREILTTQ